MISLTKVTLYGFKTEHAKVDVDLSGSNVSIIFGENGCGKTTFLKVLHAILSQDESILIQNNIQRAEISYVNYDNALTQTSPLSSLSTMANKHKIIINRKYFSECSVSDGDEEDEYTYDWDDFLESDLAETYSLSLGVERGLNDKGIKVEPRYIFDFFRHPKRRSLFNQSFNSLGAIAEELSDYLNSISTRHVNFRRNERNSLKLDKKNLELQNIKIDNIQALLVDKYRIARVTATQRIQKALFETLSVAVRSAESTPFRDQVPPDFNDELYENSERIIEALDDGENNQFKTTIIDILRNLDDPDAFEQIRKNNILTRLFINIMEELKYERLILSSVNLLVDTFNKYLINGKQLIVNNNAAFIQYGPDTHSLNELSSGERHVLTFLSLVLFEGGRRDFLIIDEPEISLNITWQRELIPLFQSLIPETQIIVASHSPSICNNNMDYLCELKLDLSGNL